MINYVPYRPAISNVLLRASASDAFRMKLLSCPEEALAGLDLPPEDVEILTNIRTTTLADYARQVKIRLLAAYSFGENLL